jgi:beta-lactamase regulating signal transducer with metallopeptidase domain
MKQKKKENNMFSIDILNNNLILEFVAKSTIVMAIAYALYQLFKKNAPSFRYIILVTAIYTVFFLPLFLYAELTYDLEVDAPIFKEKTLNKKSEIDLSNIIVDDKEPSQARENDRVTSKNNQQSENGFWNFFLSLTLNDAILLIWLVPFSIIMIRFFVAYISIMIIAARAKKISSQEQKIQMIDLCDEIGLNQYVKLLISKDSITPMTWGIFQPFILLPKEAEEWSDERLRYVLLHELAHIKRKDFISNIIIQIVTAILWFNPLSWFIQKQLLNDREYACDDHVVENGTKASEYADHLLEIAKSIQKNHSSLTSTMCMAKPSQLEGRLMALLKNKSRSMNAGEKILKLSISLMIMLPVIFINPIKASEPVVASDPKAATFSDQNQKNKSSQFDRQAEEENSETKEFSKAKNKYKADSKPMSINSEISSMTMTSETMALNFSKNKAVNDFLSNDDNTVNKNIEKNYRNYLKQHIGDSLKLEDYIKMKRYGITPEYVNDLLEMGFNDLTVDEVIDFAKHGVSIPYIKKYKSLGLKKLSAHDYVSMAKYGVNPKLVYDLQKIEKDLHLHDIINAAKYGLSGSFIDEIHDAGFTKLKINDLINMSKYGVSKKLIKTLKSNNFKDIDANDVIDAAKYGLNPELIDEIRSSGYKNISLKKMTQMAKYGVNANLIRALHDEGYKKIDADEIISAAKYGLSPSYIKEMNKYYGERISLDYLIKFSKYGVNKSMIKSLKEKGHKKLDKDELIDAAKHGLSSDIFKDLKDIGVDIKGDIQSAINLTKYGINKKVIKKLIDKNIIEDTDIESMINLSKYGISEAIIDATYSLLDNIEIDLDDIIDMAKYDINPEKIKMFKSMGFKHYDFDDLRKASMYGLDKKLIDECKKYGFKNLDFDDYIKIAMHRPDFKIIPVLKEMGIKKIDSDDFVQLGIAGVNYTFLKELKDIKPEDGWDIERIIQVKHSGLDVEYIKEMKKKFDEN